LLDLAVVDDDVVGQRQALFARALSGDDRIRLFLAALVARHYAGALNFHWHVHDQNAIGQFRQGGAAGEQRHDQQRVGCGRRLQLFDQALVYERVRNLLQPPPGCRVGKDYIAQPAPVQTALLIENAVAKGLYQLGKRSEERRVGKEGRSRWPEEQ